MPVSIEAKKKSCVEALANTEFARYTIFRLKEIARDHPPGRPAIAPAVHKNGQSSIL